MELHIITKQLKSSYAMSFEVWGVRVSREFHGEDPYEFRHIVSFNKEQGIIEYT